jgi:adenylate kinase family enzyme
MLTIPLNGLSDTFGWLGLTGQSGAGKDTVARYITDKFTEIGIPYIYFANGDLLRDEVDSGSYLGQAIKTALNRGERISKELMTAIYIGYLAKKKFNGTQIVVHNGTPRFKEDFEFMKGVTTNPYLGRPVMLEVCAPHDFCKEMLAERTKKDQREDLSLDGHPGVPDDAKIEKKLSWWNMEVEEIRRPWILDGAHCSIQNIGTLDDLKQKVCALVA